MVILSNLHARRLFLRQSAERKASTDPRHCLPLAIRNYRYEERQSAGGDTVADTSQMYTSSAFELLRGTVI